MRQSCAVLGGGGVLCAVGRCGQAALRPMPSALHYAAHAERPPAIAPRTPVHQRSDARRLPHAVTPNCAHRAAHAPTCAAHTRSRSPSSIPRAGALVQSCRRTTPPAGALRSQLQPRSAREQSYCAHTETSFGPAHCSPARTRRLSTRHHVKVESLLFVHSRPCSTAAHCTAMAITQHRSPSTQRHYTELCCTAPSTTLHAAHGALHCPCHTPRPPSAVLRPHCPPQPHAASGKQGPFHPSRHTRVTNN